MKHIKAIVNSDSYFPEKERKNHFLRVFENYIWAIINHEPNYFYNAYGLDIKGAKTFKGNYIDCFHFKTQRNALITNKSDKQVLRNKALFADKMKSAGVPTPEVIDRVTIASEADSEALYKKYENSDVFVKSINGECADGVYHIKSHSDRVNIPNGEYIVQNRIIQNSKLASLNDNSINSIRMCTYLHAGKIDVLTSGLRVGTKISGSVDNWAAGGIFVGIREGKLCEYGFYKPQYGLKTNIHPESGIKFLGFEIPFYAEAEQIVKKAHMLLPGVKLIGWDVAISDNGPIIIEGNDNWEFSLMQQVSENGLKKQWQDCINEIMHDKER